MMAIESAAIPLPSEIIMPLAGWMLVKERSLGAPWLLLAACESIAHEPPSVAR